MPELGDFAVVRTDGWKARIIRWATRSPVNHAVVYVGLDEIVEAQPGGAVISPVTEYDGLIWSTGVVALTDAQRAAIAASALRTVGTPYGWLDIVAIGLSTLGIHLPGLDARLCRSDRLICSQLVAVCYEAAGVELVPGKPANEVTPGDLYDVIKRK